MIYRPESQSNSSLPTAVSDDSSETQEVAELKRVFFKQKKAALESPYTSLDTRIEWLKQLERMIAENRRTYSRSISEDFGSHPEVVSDLYETGAVIGRSRFFRRQLPEWLQPTEIALNAKLHGSSKAQTIVLPKGVVGNIAPWNFPVECALVMVADMLAAGNRVIVKPSQDAPATAEALATTVKNFFADDVLSVMSPVPTVTKIFPQMPWDHLTYTGSSAVGKIIMHAAAENLTPVTLELGGKNPAVFLEDGLDDGLVRAFLEARALKGGQVCVAPQYVLVPAQILDRWVETARRVWSAMYPKYVGHPDATSMINEKHYNRVLRIVDEARTRGVTVISLNNDEPNQDLKQIPLYLIVDPPDDLTCMQEEIFGPVTPVCSFESFDEVTWRINSGPTPLASYIATYDHDLANKFVRTVKSGGAAVNNFGSQAGLPNIPFGGLGSSGIGCHSGHQGFLNYSHQKSLFFGTPDSAVSKAMQMPFGESARAFVDGIFRITD